MRNKLIQYLVKNLLAAISEEDIITVTNRGWLKGKRKMDEAEVTQLKQEAEELKKSVLWNYMSNEVRWLANLQMFEKGISKDNTVFGRAMLYNLELCNKFLDRISRL